jgi:hypothetical protein
MQMCLQILWSATRTPERFSPRMFPLISTLHVHVGSYAQFFVWLVHTYTRVFTHTYVHKYRCILHSIRLVKYLRHSYFRVRNRICCPVAPNIQDLEFRASYFFHHWFRQFSCYFLPIIICLLIQVTGPGRKLSILIYYRKAVCRSSIKWFSRCSPLYICISLYVHILYIYIYTYKE